MYARPAPWSMSLRDVFSEKLAAYRNVGPRHAVATLARYALAHAAPLPRSTPAGGRVTIALTTLPSRVDALGPALFSLLRQDVPARVVLALPARSTREDRDYALAPALRDVPGLTILRCERDWGPATKLVPVLHSGLAPDALVLVVDDDNVYPRDLVANFLHWHSRYPDAALGYRGWDVPPSRRWRDSRTLHATGLREPRIVDVLTATWGVLVQPRFFDASFTDYAAADRASFFVDDIWTSGHLARRGVERRVVPAARPPVSTLACRRNALSRGENRDGRHNDTMLAAFASSWGAPAC